MDELQRDSGLNNVPILQSNVAMSSTVSAVGSTDYLQVTVSLPASAGTSTNISNFQNKSTTVKFSWSATNG